MIPSSLSSEMPADCPSRLPSDVLLLILCRLPVADYVRSGAVSTSWRRATVGKNPRRNPKTPWLMLSGVGEDPDNPDSFTFFSISDRTYRSFHLPQIGKKRCVGSSNGSIIAAERGTDILLLDPLTDVEVHLPPIAAGPYPPERIECPLILKLVFSPSASVAVAIFEEISHLSFVLFGIGPWTICKENNYISDIALHKGKFYLLSRKALLLSLEPAKDGNMTFRGHGDDSFHYYHFMYLVESVDGDHLLLVCRTMNGSWKHDIFKVFRQEKDGLRWVAVKSLGEVAIFVGENYSVCVFTRGLPELRGNCVYYIEDVTLVQSKDDFGVFDLEDGCPRQFVSLQYNRRSRRAPFWLMPSSS